MIPKIIHQVWIGPKPAPKRLMESWRDMHPTWEYRLWGNDHVGWENQDEIDIMPELNGKCDMMRFEILRNHGGVVLDADSECIRPLDESFLHHDCWACYENEIVRPGLIACGAMGAVKGCVLFQSCVAAIKSQYLNAPAWSCVGPMFLTSMAKDYPGMHIFPARMFIPVHFTGRAAPGDAPIYARQYWGSTKGYDKII